MRSQSENEKQRGREMTRLSLVHTTFEREIHVRCGNLTHLHVGLDHRRSNEHRLRVNFVRRTNLESLLERARADLYLDGCATTDI